MRRIFRMLLNMPHVLYMENTSIPYKDVSLQSIFVKRQIKAHKMSLTCILKKRVKSKHRKIVLLCGAYLTTPPYKLTTMKIIKRCMATSTQHYIKLKIKQTNMGRNTLLIQSDASEPLHYLFTIIVLTVREVGRIFCWSIFDNLTLLKSHENILIFL